MATDESFSDLAICSIQNASVELDTIWNAVGLSPSKRMDRQKVFHENIAKVCSDTVKQEKDAKLRLVQDIDLCREEVLTIVDELNINPPQWSKTYTTLLEERKAILTELHQHQETRQKRINSREQLMSRQQVLCELLGEDMLDPPPHAVPTHVQLIKLQEHIQHLEKEKCLRQLEFSRLKRGILVLLVQLEEATEEEACSSSREEEKEEDLCLTRQHLQTLANKHSDLEFRHSEVLVHWQELHEQLDTLWPMLDVPESERQQIRDCCSTHSPSVIQKLEHELLRLKTLRLANITVFVARLKLQLQEAWHRCWLPEGEWEKAPGYCDDPPVETSLELLEAELERLRCYEEQHIEILAAATEFDRLFDELLRLVRLANDPGRLFNTRGGALLQEERQRNRIKVEMPRMQDRLITLYEAYPNSHEGGDPPLLRGVTVPEYVMQRWAQHDAIREKNDKNTRQKKLKRINNSKPTASQNVVTPALSKPLAATVARTAVPLSARATPATNAAATTTTATTTTTTPLTHKRAACDDNEDLDDVGFDHKQQQSSHDGQPVARGGPPKRARLDDVRHKGQVMKHAGRVAAADKTTVGAAKGLLPSIVLTEVGSTTTGCKTPAAMAPAVKKLPCTLPRVGRPLSPRHGGNLAPPPPRDITALDYRKFEQQLRSSRDRLNSTAVDASLCKENLPAHH